MDLAADTEAFGSDKAEDIDQVLAEGDTRIRDYDILDLGRGRFYVIEDYRETVWLFHVFAPEPLPEYPEHRGEVGLVSDHEGHLSLLGIDVGKIADLHQCRDLVEDSDGNKDRDFRVDENVKFVEHSEKVVVEKDIVRYLPVVLPPGPLRALDLEILDGLHLFVLHKSRCKKRTAHCPDILRVFRHHDLRLEELAHCMHESFDK